MTELIKQLLHDYGLLSITYDTLNKDRNDEIDKTYEEYLNSLGDIQVDEPGLVVKISEDAQHRILNPGEHDYLVKDDSGNTTKNVSVLEMPEDDYYYFGAFGSGIYDLQKELPAFMLGLGIIHAYSLFEAYLSEVIKLRYRKNPLLIGRNKKLEYSEVFDCESKDDLIETIVEKAVRELMYLPITGLLDTFRERLGFRSLSSSYDDDTKKISLIRNCLVHNRGIADLNLCEAFPESYEEGMTIELNQNQLNKTILTLRKLSYQIDQQLEQLSLNQTLSTDSGNSPAAG